jgi:hypothetical protein
MLHTAGDSLSKKPREAELNEKAGNSFFVRFPFSQCPPRLKIVYHKSAIFQL